jgi:lipoprotein-releasing system permease protein
MKDPVIRSIAWRFMLKGTEKGTFSPMTLFAWLAIAVGVAAMASLLSVMYGFESSLKERVLKAYPHIMVRPRVGNQPIKGYEEWTKRFREMNPQGRVMPYVETEMIVQSERRALGAVIWGTPLPDLEQLKPNITEGKLPAPDSPIPQVILGSELAHRLSVELGSPLKIISPTEKRGAMGLIPQSQAFEVSALYSSGHYEFDEQYLYMVLEDAQDLMRWKNGISGWHLWAPRLEDAADLQKRIAAVLPPEWEAQSWEAFNSSLFHSLKLEQYSMFSILCFAVVIAVMNIVITLMMHVTHKRKNIGILRALGASKRQVRRIFIWQGALLGGVGLVIGALLTVLFIVYVRYFSSYQLPDIYYDRSIPIEIRPLSMLLIYAVAIVLIYFATLYPSGKAAKLDPIEAIRE